MKQGCSSPVFWQATYLSVGGGPAQAWAPLCPYTSAIDDSMRNLLTDPQTSGGLLVACKAERAEAIRAAIEAAGYPRASVIGTVAAGAPGIEVV